MERKQFEQMDLLSNPEKESLEEDPSREDMEAYRKLFPVDGKEVSSVSEDERRLKQKKEKAISDYHRKFSKGQNDLPFKK